MKNALRNDPESIEDVLTLKQRIRELEQSVAESRRIEEALRASEVKYRLAFESTSDGIFTVDCNFNISNITPSVERQLGYKVEEVINRPIQDLNILTSESLSRAVSDVIQVLSGVEVKGAVYEFIAKDGTRKIGEVTGTPIIKEGKILGVTAVVRDITDRKRIEEALAESEKKYRLIAEKMTDIVWIQDMNLCTVYISPSIEAMLGFSPEERMAQDVHEQLTPASMSIAMDVMAKELELEQQGQVDPERKIIIELEYYHKDGSTRWFENIISGIRNDQGVLTGLHGVSRDITKRKQVEDALRENEKKYRELVDFLPISLFEVDLQGNVTSANPAIFETFGYTQPDFEKGLNGFQLISPDDQERLAGNIQRLLNGGWKGPSEYTGIRKDGSTFPLMIFPSVIMRKGEPVGLSGAIIDLTDRKLLEESLKKSNLSLSEAQQIAHIGNWEWDFVSNSMHWSDEVYRITKSAPRMFDGTLESFFEYVFPKEREMVKKAVEKAMHEGAAIEIDHRIVRRDGEVREVHQMLEPIIDDSGKIIKVVGIIQDVTEKNQVERDLQNAKDQLLQSEKLAAIGRLAAGVMHEILNPVNIISMELQILIKQSELSPKARQMLIVCKDQIQRIVTIAEGLKGFSSIKGKRLAMNDIAAAVDHILVLCQPQLNMIGIQTDVQYSADLPRTLMDREMIEQVILNLLENAIDAMEEKEEKVLRITIGTRTVTGKKDCLRVTIADTGTGIQKQNLVEIFEPFFTTKGPGKGTGLGLSISFGIINDHGGRIWAENNEWGGASFFFEIPITTDKDGAVLKQEE